MKVAPIENTLLAFLFNKKLSETQKGKDNELQGKCSFTYIFCDRGDIQFQFAACLQS